MGESPNDGQNGQSSCWRRECRKIKFQQCNKFAHATFIYSIVCSLFIFFYFVKLFWWNNLSRFNVACAACLTREQQRGGCSDKLIFYLYAFCGTVEPEDLPLPAKWGSCFMQTFENFAKILLISAIIIQHHILPPLYMVYTRYTCALVTRTDIHHHVLRFSGNN